MIDPRIWESEQFANLSIFERLLYVGLISNADDHGRLRDHPSWIRSIVFPYDDYKIPQIVAGIIAIEKTELIYRYQTPEWCIIQHPKWSKYQTVNRPQDSKYPAYDPEIHILVSDSVNDSVNAHVPKEVKGKEVKTPLALKFQKFWDAYPKRKSRGNAEKAFNAIKPDEQLVATMIATIERATKSEDWLKEGGKYIPYPATWLRAKGWEDELEMAATDPMASVREAYPDAG